MNECEAPKKFTKPVQMNPKVVISQNVSPNWSSMKVCESNEAGRSQIEVSDPGSCM